MLNSPYDSGQTHASCSAAKLSHRAVEFRTVRVVQRPGRGPQMASSVELSSSLQLDQLSLPVDAQEARDAPTLDLFDHHAQRLHGFVAVGRVPPASSHCRDKEHVPVDTNRMGLFDKCGEGADFLGQFVHAHRRG